MIMKWSAFWGFVGVATGAFGAHALKSTATETDLNIWNTACRYVLLHAVVLLCISILYYQKPHPRLKTIAWCFHLGCCIFGGSLWLLVLTSQRWLGAITPLGGLCFLVGWVLIFLLPNTEVFQRDENHTNSLG